ncbi:sigma factor G inhibitor Gin [Proteinivorax tanatarense]|uniref:Sigma factor G inhibitor Gin n=1 Tax=Proteinivorax tanatarense TaxID=1260629 RepID=A0AAU7VLP5_9FIRM
MENNCILCSCQTKQGIKILESFICTKCVDLVSKAEVENPNYKDILFKMKKIWAEDDKGQAAKN